MDGNLAAVGIKGDGGETGNGCVDVDAGNGTIRDELRVVVQQGWTFNGDSLVIEDDGGREQHVGLGNAGSGESTIHTINRF